jgi:hypothetical protein
MNAVGDRKDNIRNLGNLTITGNAPTERWPREGRTHLADPFSALRWVEHEVRIRIAQLPNRGHDAPPLTP